MIYRCEINTNTYTICIEWKNPNTRTRLICWSGHTCPTLFPIFLILIPNVVQRICWTKYDLGINQWFFYHGKFENIFKNMLLKCEMCYKGKQLHLHETKKLGEIFVIYMINLICACIYGIWFWGYCEGLWWTSIKGIFKISWKYIANYENNK